MTDKTHELLVLGIGNLLWADEGFGVRCVEALQVGWQTGPRTLLMDGGTQGLYLLPYIEEARRLIVFDAVDYGRAPGELVVAVDREVPRFMGVKKMSLHQTGFQEVLMAAELLGRLPESMVLIGVQAEQLEDYGGSLRDSVRAQIDPALAIACDWMQRWGLECQPRSAPPEGPALNAAALQLSAYEDGRPSAEAACRFGDARVLAGRVAG